MSALLLGSLLLWTWYMPCHLGLNLELEWPLSLLRVTVYDGNRLLGSLALHAVFGEWTSIRASHVDE